MFNASLSEVKLTLHMESTWQPTRPSRWSESLSAKAFQWQLRHGNIGRSDCVKEVENKIELKERMEQRGGRMKKNDATTNCKKARMQRQRKIWVERCSVRGWIEISMQEQLYTNTITKHDHGVLRPQTTSWTTTDDGENFHGWEPAPAISRCQHS